MTALLFVAITLLQEGMLDLIEVRERAIPSAVIKTVSGICGKNQYSVSTNLSKAQNYVPNSKASVNGEEIVKSNLSVINREMRSNIYIVDLGVEQCVGQNKDSILIRIDYAKKSNLHEILHSWSLLDGHGNALPFK